jgi:hypothetical protein
MKTAATVMVLALLAGCAPQYVQPEPTQPSAQLRIVSSRERAFSAQSFVAYGDDECAQTSRDFGLLAGFNWAGDREADKLVRVWPDRRLFIKAVVQVQGELRTAGAMSEQDINYCTALVSFVSQGAKRYEARQAWSDTVCTLSVVDVETLQPPLTFEVHPIKEPCKIQGAKPRC